MKTIELLAPARDLSCGLAAVNCGADAVYIGAGKFSARAAAANTTGSIERLSSYARRFRARVYVALNTILQNHEIDEARNIAWEVFEAGADGLIIQDMGLLEIDLPPIPLIASTQTDNSDWKKIKFLEQAGFKRAILARELTLKEIAFIREHTSIELECFVHGALCVSYSGRCHFSYALTGRSSNRGVCSQPCRMSYSLIDGSQQVLEKNKYLLSLKDLNLSDHLDKLINAGVSSFKIEGRLKEADYIKNIVSYYRRKLDKILKSMNLDKSSSGESHIEFVPDANKTFSRGFTDYFINGRKNGFATVHTQKSTGEFIGVVNETGPGFFTIESGKENILKPGDGICYYDSGGTLSGGVINKVENGKIYPFDSRFIIKDASIYRNHNHEFLKRLERGKIERLIPINILACETGEGLRLSADDLEGVKAVMEFKFEKITALNRDDGEKTLKKQLSRLGGTIYRAENIRIDFKEIPFLQVKTINAMRRELITKLDLEREKGYKREICIFSQTSYPYPEKVLDYTYNVSNDKARSFYFRHGVKKIEGAAESGLPMNGKKIMKCRYCLRYELGLCGNGGGDLTLTDGRSDFTLKFDCSSCIMEIYLGKV